MSVTSDAPEARSEARRALLEQRRKGRASAKPAESAITRRPPDAPVLASLGQERLWFVQQLQPTSSAYHMTHAVRLRGTLAGACLRAALQVVVDRHESLRTTLVLHNGVLMQQIVPSWTVALDEMPVAAGQIEHAIQELSAARFDLAQGPLLRATLLCEAPDSAVLVVVMHHIISDEWSLGVFWRDLAAAYRALLAGAQPQLAPLPLHYADWAWYQREQLARGAYDSQLAYWMQQLAGELPLLQLPTDHQRPPVQQYRGAFVTRPLAAALARRIVALGRAAGATPFSVLLAAFQVFLYRFTRQHDVLVGTPVTNRSDAQTHELIGFFLNTAVLRADFSQPLRFDALLDATCRQSVAALANQDIPFDRLVEALKPRRDPSHHPIFQAMFVFQDASSHGVELPGLTAEPLVIDAGVSKFDITLFAALGDDGLTLSLEYSTALLERGTVERWLRSFEVLLESIAENPSMPVDQLVIVPPEERRVLIEDWVATGTQPIPELCIHDLIAAQPPDLPAVVFNNEALTYGALDTHANQLAHYLHGLGLPSGAVVGLCVERSIAMAVGIVGILKAGCAYVPIDPAYPAERVRYLIEDANIAVMLTQSHLRALLPDDGVRLVTLDDPAIAEQLQEAPTPRAKPDDLAYMIYTSGSTGLPKGVRVSHRNLVHSTTARFTYYPEPAKSFLLLSSFAFDSSLVGIFWTLCQGGVLCLPPPQGEHDVLQLAHLIEHHVVTHTLMLPSLYALLLDFATTEQLRSLNTVIVAGEACPLGLATQHYALVPGAALYNEYGPTEGTVWATAWRIPPAPERILIGRAIPNMQTLILDEQRSLVPLGVPGELYIGGAGISAGYHNRPELTGERFVSNPFVDQRASAGRGDRLYRTGDLVRYRADGEIEFLGRVDTQVKLNGYRLELGEIEAVLLEHPAVHEAVVLLVSESQAPVDFAVDTAALLRLLHERPDAARLLADVEALSDEVAEMLVRQHAEKGS
jgi:amino acid adenylation domain-containing protein